MEWSSVETGHRGRSGNPTFGESAFRDPTIARLLGDDLDEDELSAAALALAMEDLIQVPKPSLSPILQ